MPGILAKYIAIDIEITMMSYFNGIPFTVFHLDNPFVQRNNYRPLPFWNSGNGFNNGILNNNNVYWAIEEELTIDIPSLDLMKAFNCFNLIPSAGAKYSLKLCADVPNNDKPMQMPPEIGSDTGHSFVVVTKTNGTKHVTQVFGFYAQTHPGYLFPWRGMASTIKNNQLREINASIEMGLTQAQFELLREKAFELAKNKYNAVSYNCTNYGLDLFNSVRSKPITTESYTVYIPHNNQNMYGTSKPEQLDIKNTPQKLFKKLKEMKESKTADASSITIDTTNKTQALLSHGEWN
jgi:hypothetical protein